MLLFLFHTWKGGNPESLNIFPGDHTGNHWQNSVFLTSLTSTVSLWSVTFYIRTFTGRGDFLLKDSTNSKLQGLFYCLLPFIAFFKPTLRIHKIFEFSYCKFCKLANASSKCLLGININRKKLCSSIFEHILIPSFNSTELSE